MKRLQILSLMILIGVGVACSKKECCTDIDLSSSTKSITALGYADAPLNMGINVNAPYLIVNNKEDYDTLVSGTCHPNIDFSKYQLIIGYFASQRKVLDFNYKYYSSCEKVK